MASFPESKVILLTATAPPAILKEIQVKLEMEKATIVRVNPDRPNIMYQKVVRPVQADQAKHLQKIMWQMAIDLREEREKFPLTIIYTTTDVIAFSWDIFENVLGFDQYDGVPIPETRLFQQYHSKTCPELQKHIIQDLGTEKPVTRLVLATNCLGMGLDAKCVERVIHYKPPTSLERLIQESGRAGRSGQDSVSIVYYNNTDLRKNRPGIEQSIVDYCRSDSCLRQVILNLLGYAVDPERKLCKCCDHCKKECDCDDCILQTLPQVFDVESDLMALNVQIKKLSSTNLNWICPK